MEAIEVIGFDAWQGVPSLSLYTTKAILGLRHRKLPHKLTPCKRPPKKIATRRRVPVIVHSGRVIEDSTEILQYLDTLPAEGDKLWPEGQAERADACILEDWADYSLSASMHYVMWHIDEYFERFGRAYIVSQLPPVLGPFVAGRVRKSIRVKVLKGFGLTMFSREEHDAKFQELLDALEGRLETRDYLVNDTITSADIAVFSCVLPMERFETREAQSGFGRCPKLAAWFRRMDGALMLQDRQQQAANHGAG